MKVLILFVLLYLVFFVEISLAHKLDEDEQTVRLNKKDLLLAAAVLFITALLSSRENIAVGAAACPFWSSMVAAAYSDRQIKKAYDFFFFIAFVSGLVTVSAAGVSLSSCIADVCIFCLVQRVLFRRMYGVADCMAFGVCAVFFAAFGRDLFDYLCLMLIAFFMALTVQLCRRNLNKKGNLKVPIAYIPYITVAAIVFYGYIGKAP